MRLTEKEISFLALMRRSPDMGYGWRRVSSLLWRLVEEFEHRELIETEQCTDGSGLVRLSDRGRIVEEYLV
jgi:hypothetical protein